MILLSSADIQSDNLDDFLFLNFDLEDFGPSVTRSAVTSELNEVNVLDASERLKLYRRYLYVSEVGDVATPVKCDRLSLREFNRAGYFTFWERNEGVGNFVNLFQLLPYLR